MEAYKLERELFSLEMLGFPREEMQLLMLKKENYVLILLLDLSITFRNMKHLLT